MQEDRGVDDVDLLLYSVWNTIWAGYGRGGGFAKGMFYLVDRKGVG